MISLPDISDALPSLTDDDLRGVLAACHDEVKRRGMNVFIEWLVARNKGKLLNQRTRPAEAGH
jgi:hypothetical protein